ncbi:MAG: DUF721 domain-containing protein [Deltaproteobacteria bacterium]|nr:DUF721 domain-containing protein [Deltaproteobacteria bacterium]MBW2048865.1 DUF721 domain-containing protein [Deltaproteobacteria bacterium]MBW2112384.1 DUF721 domain-containing protein [Deltaproteobacteria bacterium]MBW2352582.1 DUF721 domain-containing protein [Deltaproteobacteria bacterium]HDZ90327.1 DUF721 domain-containing protein [Deltaproteobacteria bacterium]
MKSQPKDLTSLGDIISGLLNDGTLPFNPDDVEIWQVWDEVVGEPYSGNTSPSQIRNRRLRVTVYDSVSLQDLKFQENQIRVRLNKKLGRPAIERIDFRLGSR